MSEPIVIDSSFRLTDPTKEYSHLNAEKVLTVHHWTDRLFSFTCTRTSSLRFENGQFCMIGIEVDGKPLLRAYSVASANYEEELEFLSIKVPDGPLTSRLCHMQVGDTVLIGRKPTGTLVLSNLKPGRNLYFFSTGTGLAPFMSLIRDPEVYENFDHVILTHGVRTVGELAYRDYITKELPNHEFLGEDIAKKLIYYPTVTREDFPVRDRITTLVNNEKLFSDINLPVMDPELDRAMICGSPEMLVEIKAILENRGFTEGNGNSPGSFVIEKAFAEQ
ncbi:Flavodoxin/ferredoxin--NADP reductase (Fpr) (PDB:3OZU) [Commensalibacter communis]|uniref:ferredoxin--NADP(+) reductase n=1 Tax=Commensalibacter communis TaxID=2972786 RepID=A0A9W4XH05_9PROT|nr:ferredoxin--NADP reductase [Commensalibacter communis]CAI3926559.1 Flavodoxin/ferredoxin--NADP reductase (Fpr) (PDB:3OZU) [Commensalibacter communis]CAI3926587.1 Flavodoxin/ferredoxin--NADP reductase (Fpr) (PDB:3OZU) [Commensalibacter communis]CAI3926626.1 Flavodoxin/ferredoxin--NADP reductase (Fpr) (PDB:3OZU) [Commensalibacter communis]CAI3928111.1 Flavodoxin/ferredoxin--NADP reductase (Fpr) (PDB:3OZU) [Commensalibacter communis]CAI3928144.1 Flavodoxin/ferredoxin--NADP reductase (Fpr) (PDB